MHLRIAFLLAALSFGIATVFASRALATSCAVPVETLSLELVETTADGAPAARPARRLQAELTAQALSFETPTVAYWLENQP